MRIIIATGIPILIIIPIPTVIINPIIVNISDAPDVSIPADVDAASSILNIFYPSSVVNCNNYKIKMR